MVKELPNLSIEQFTFLAVLHAFETPVSINIAGVLAPILPGPFLDLLGGDNKQKFICRTENEHYSLIADLPCQLTDRLKTINTPERISAIIDRLYDEKLIDRIKPEHITGLIAKSGYSRKKRAEIEIDLAQKLLKKRDTGTAFNLLKSVVKRFYSIPRDPGESQLFVSAVIELSNIWFFLGKNYYELTPYLKRALDISKSMGDKRSYAILNLLVSTCLDFAGERAEAWEAFYIGYKKVEELGDDDILDRTAPVLGRYFALQGLIKDAAFHFERAFQIHELGETKVLIPDLLSNPILYGIYLAFLGQFHEALGVLFYFWQMAEEKADKIFITISKAFLAMALLMIKKNKPAVGLLASALKEAKNSDNTFIRYVTQGNLTYMHFLEGRIEKARKMLSIVTAFGEKRGVVGYFVSPQALEMLFEFERLGYPPHPRLNYKDEIKKVLKGRNVHLQGVGLRLEAVASYRRNDPISQIENYLIQSEKYLVQAGDKIQLAKTLLERARVKLGIGDKKEEALNLIHKACECFGDYAPVFFPEDLKHLLDASETTLKSKTPPDDIYKRMLKAYDSISFGENIDDIKYNLLKNICNIVKAERAALFRFDKEQKSEEPSIVTLYNITQGETNSSRFKDAIKLVKQAHKSKKISIRRSHNKPGLRKSFPIRAMCCLPITFDDEVSRILYLDNIFLEDRYDLVDAFLISKLVKQAEFQIDRMLKYEKFKGERDILASERTFLTEHIKDNELWFKDSELARIISQADKVAPTDSTILISGETGTGKELLARRIHHLSSRNTGPLVIVDLTSIPENLLESELYGYEKGAFTGAAHRKRGRLELAHNGTLFLDEIGEAPLSFQVMLLRVLQEKKFMRVGGTHVLHSDFRLITATNRNLEEEIRCGRFRQDLFFRLNVMPIVLPPLRQRGSDILLLAQFFLDQYAKKYNRHNISLTLADKEWLTAYSWPGNVRELKNIMERAVILSTDGELNFSAVNNPVFGPIEQPGFLNANPEKTLETPHIPIDDFPSLDEVQRRYIKWVLEKTSNKMGGPGGATEILKLKRSTLYSRMGKLGMRSSLKKSLSNSV